jgi:hypothetical protein
MFRFQEEIDAFIEQMRLKTLAEIERAKDEKAKAKEDEEKAKKAKQEAKPYTPRPLPTPAPVPWSLAGGPQARGLYGFSYYGDTSPASRLFR